MSIKVSPFLRVLSGEGKMRYVGLIARKRGIRIEAPEQERYDRQGLYDAIKEFTNKK